MKKELRAKIFGQVQGVFFRANTQKRAQELGITGWVRNANDGCVEILAQAEEDSLKRFLEWCRRGPEGAHVEKVEAAWTDFKEESTKDLRSFSIKYGRPDAVS